MLTAADFAGSAPFSWREVQHSIQRYVINAVRAGPCRLKLMSSHAAHLVRIFLAFSYSGDCYDAQQNQNQPLLMLKLCYQCCSAAALFYGPSFLKFMSILDKNLKFGV